MPFKSNSPRIGRGDRTERNERSNRAFNSNSEKSDRPYRSERSGGERSGGERGSSSNSDRPYSGGRFGGERRSSSDRPYSGGRFGGERGSSSDRPSRGGRFGSERGSSSDRPYSGGRFGGERGSSSDRPSGGGRFGGGRSERPYNSERGERSERPRRSFGSDSERGERSERPRRSFGSDSDRGERSERPRRSFGSDSDRGERSERPRRSFGSDRDSSSSRYGRTDRNRTAASRKQEREDDELRLNRFIALSGLCSRREADDLILSGAVTVNGEICNVLGTLVKPSDKVVVGGEALKAEKKVYILMNKPKGYITTADDPQERDTVMELLRGACSERIYPVGRLDRNTTGVLLFTNDGDLTKVLTHPSHGAKKIYHVGLDKAFAKSDMQSLLDGIELDDGPINVDEISYVEEGQKKEVGVKIHSGRNRIIRRMFEHLGYKVCKLDRVVFADLTKKNLKRGAWRPLTEAEIQFLKMKK